MSAWLFFDTDQQVEQCEHDGRSDLLRGEFLNLLQADGYPAEMLAAVSFTFDSHENVIRNYDGSYFNRLR